MIKTKYIGLLILGIIIYACKIKPSNITDESKHQRISPIIHPTLKNAIYKIRSKFDNENLLIDVVFRSDSSIMVLSDIAVQTPNYRGYLVDETNIPSLIYVQEFSEYFADLIDTSAIVKGNPDKYPLYDSLSELPPFEPYLIQFRFENDSLQLVKEGFF